MCDDVTIGVYEQTGRSFVDEESYNETELDWFNELVLNDTMFYSGEDNMTNEASFNEDESTNPIHATILAQANEDRVDLHVLNEIDALPIELTVGEYRELRRELDDKLDTLHRRVESLTVTNDHLVKRLTEQTTTGTTLRDRNHELVQEVVSLRQSKRDSEAYRNGRTLFDILVAVVFNEETRTTGQLRRIISTSDTKIAAIKEVRNTLLDEREELLNLGLRDAKQLVDAWLAMNGCQTQREQDEFFRFRTPQHNDTTF